MQIITGKYRARKLVPVDAKTTRPTLARVKESIFNLVQTEIAGRAVLDLFAGSGAFGAECISRGASSVVFVDHEPKAIATIKKNTSGMTEDFEILKSDYLGALETFARQKKQFGLVYLDPPFASNFAAVAIDKLVSFGLLEDGAIIIVEHGSQNDLINLPECIIIKKSKKYGTIFVDIFEANI